jgi:hypothetical protein
MPPKKAETQFLFDVDSPEHFYELIGENNKKLCGKF